MKYYIKISSYKLLIYPVSGVMNGDLEELPYIKTSDSSRECSIQSVQILCKFKKWYMWIEALGKYALLHWWIELIFNWHSWYYCIRGIIIQYIYNQLLFPQY